MTDSLPFKKLTPTFYTRSNVVEIAAELIGKVLVSNINGNITCGRIVEAEAYAGLNDKACHANEGKRTKRTEIMYAQGGCVYVYLCYGMHILFNVVTNTEGNADAVLIRALEPVFGLETMMERRNMGFSKRLTSGPSLLSKAMGISMTDYGLSLQSERLWIGEEIGQNAPEILACPRIGVAYAAEDALKPWRFCAKDNPWISIKLF
jgi:DNA-3-methyladenine glycosylase